MQPLIRPLSEFRPTAINQKVNIKDVSDMKKKKSASALLVCAMSLSAGSVWAAGDSTTINVKGKIVSNTCVIDTTNSDLTVTLPTLSDKDFKSKGVVAGKKTVNLVLKDCGKDTSKVDVTASGDPDDTDKSAFKNAATGGDAATGVGLYFYETDGNTLFLPNGTKEESSLDATKTNTLAYTAAYVATAATVSAGGFASVVNLMLEYQ
ncbi:type 1 fimbrial protein [Pantoea sp. VH_18]|nr:type 1 fimbrial protein [Pantoea sp. VH_24]KAA5953273.1 type 1 fimbrial protein [Pantoea sp. VH_16]KAA5959076.1 type 1 fimbrial protein [Pantoea sp. VH_18]KAA5991550.1 type 1 fimbrial protein [Pantoea sp. M_1]KAA5996263.1 type 1 fimbrial protein [Pantoea sp. F_7]KAA6004235.1 type 1 fimbrial protein [Pantoea sp. F_18]KAA6006135.1 type 1 fimbrial protein [Pantoea sp. F_5]KAA6008311.1 type 1 fimbrial protein [Pantoea sp. F_15]KAA6017642.1 type 1 fimbrial protein [Pantoea sp. F_17]KAA601958